jgi:hypothetical protein
MRAYPTRICAGRPALAAWRFANPHPGFVVFSRTGNWQHVGARGGRKEETRLKKAMGDTGFEPVTSCMSSKHSNQLS